MFNPIISIFVELIRQKKLGGSLNGNERLNNALFFGVAIVLKRHFLLWSLLLKGSSSFKCVYRGSLGDAVAH